MATLDQLKAALINADKAGDTAAAQALAAEIRRQQTAAPTQPVATTPQPEQPGFLARAADIVTGNLRETEQTQTLPDWTEMPEMNDIFSMAGWKTGLGTLMSSPDEAVQVIQANFPGVQIGKDEKGNYLLTSQNGQTYALKPGFRIGDIPRAGAAIAAFTPAGRATSMLGAGAASAGTQAVIEGTQAAAGGEFSPREVMTSGVLGAAVPAVTQMVGRMRQPLAQATGQADTPIMMQGVQAADNVPPTVAETDNVASAAPAISPSQSYAQSPQPIVAAPSVMAPPAQQVTREQFGEIANKAAKGGIGSQKAKEDLARLAQINPEVKKAAEEVGIDLPIDLMSDSRLLTEQVALSRYIKGSPQSVEWKSFIEGARTKADDVMAKIDASPDIASVSESVRQALGKTRTELETASRKIYDAVDAAVPKQSKVNLGRTQQTISEVISEVGEANLTGAERRLYQLASDPNTTYGALLREKSMIGKALQSADSANPYGSVETATLKRLYGALADDQLEVVGAVAGQEARDNLRYANQLVAKRKGLEQRIVNAYGKEGEGSIASKLTSAIRTGSKGDITQLNKVIKTVPEPLRKEALTSAMMAQARTPRGDFSFGAFESMYQGLRKNGPVYAAIEKEIGKESAELLRSLYVVSKRINIAESAISKTGSDTAATLMNQYAAQGFIGKLLEGTVGRAAVSGAPVIRKVPIIGADLAEAAVKATTTNKPEQIIAASKFITSPDFASLVEDIAKRGAEKAAQSNNVRKVATSPQFAAWANRAGLPRGIRVREQWIRDSILASKQFNQEQE